MWSLHCWGSWTPDFWFNFCLPSMVASFSFMTLGFSSLLLNFIFRCLNWLDREGSKQNWYLSQRFSLLVILLIDGWLYSVDREIWYFIGLHLSLCFLFIPARDLILCSLYHRDRYRKLMRRHVPLPFECIWSQATCSVLVILFSFQWTTLLVLFELLLATSGFTAGYLSCSCAQMDLFGYLSRLRFAF
jgi:hypothetical protein